MKFSIAFLLVAIAIAATLMMSVQKRQAIANLRLKVDVLQKETDARQQTYLISKAQVEICDQVRSRKFPNPMKRAEANFRRLQKRSLQSGIKTPNEITIASVPLITESYETYLRYRIYVPANRAVHLMADALDDQGRSTKKGNVFLPSSFSYKLPPGSSVVDIRVDRQASLRIGAFNQTGIVKKFDVTVRSNDFEDVSDLLSYQPEFQWDSRYIPIDALREESKSFLEQEQLFRSATKSVLYSAQHVADEKPTQRLEIFLQQTKPRGSIPRRAAE